MNNFSTPKVRHLPMNTLSESGRTNFSVSEVGGLVCRMPFEVELLWQSQVEQVSNSHDFLDSEDYGRKEDSFPDSFSLSAFTGGTASASASSVSSVSTKGTISRSKEDSASSNDNSFSALFAKTVFWYRAVENSLRVN